MAPLNSMSRYEVASILSDFGHIAGFDFTNHADLIQGVRDVYTPSPRITSYFENYREFYGGQYIFCPVLREKYLPADWEKIQPLEARKKFFVAALEKANTQEALANVERIGRAIQIEKLIDYGPDHQSGTKATGEQIWRTVIALVYAVHLAGDKNENVTRAAVERMGLWEEDGEPKGIIGW